MSAVRNALVLCTGNSARSILGEAILNREGEGRVRAFSAGSQPKGEPHPMALALLAEKGFPIDGLHSKSWDVFAGEGAAPIDFVFTVCDNAAGETCPWWPGTPIRAHWGIDDPAAVEGPGQRAAFERAFDALEVRIARFLALPFETMDRESLQRSLREIGEAAVQHG